MEKMDISHSIFERSSLRKCIMRGSTFCKMDFSDANLEGALLQRCYLKHVSFEGAKLRGVDFSESEMEFVDFTGADLTNVSFEDAKLRACVFSCAPESLSSADGIEKCLFLSRES